MSDNKLTKKKERIKRNQAREDNVRVGMVSLAVDCSAPADPLPMDDEDGEGGAEAGHWPGARLSKQEEQQPGLCKHQPAIGVGRPRSPGFTSLHFSRDGSLSILH